MKVRLPLSLLFACAVSAVVSPAFASTAATSSASIVGPAKPTSVFDDKYLSKQWQWYLTKNGVNIVPVWQAGITGSGVVIGIMDTWVEPNHEDLNVSPYNPTNDAYNGQGLSKDFVGSEVIPTDNPDTEEDESQTQIYTNEGEEHGQFVAGMAAAVGGNDKGVVGAAPGATIAGLHINLNNIQTILNAAYWGSGVSASGAYENEALIQVKNCSFGSVFQQGSEDEKKFWKAIADTSANNVIYVFAAGNSRGEDGTNWPGSTGWDSTGSNPNIINVGATNDSGRYTSFSCFGSNLFVTAPGEGVVSTDRTGELGYNKTTDLSSDSSTSSDAESDVVKIKDNNYAESDGTSFSSPLVAGVIALGKQVCPVMDVRWAKHALAYSSGYGDAPNIDYVYDDEKKTYVQASGYTETVTDEETGEKTEVTVSPTGNWQKNNGGYWFNNNYGFGIVNPDGFVEKVRDIAYSTVETKYSAKTSEITLVSGENLSGKAPKMEFSVGTSRKDADGNKLSVFDQKLETVSVTLLFSEAALTSNLLDIGSLKVTLVASDGKESVLVQQSAGDVAVPVNTISSGSYTFLSNAFWGSSYADTKDWTVRIEYDGAKDATDTYVDTAGWVSVGSVDFTMGTIVDERVGGIHAGQVVNAHALALDSEKFTVSGKLNVEDSVYVNGGSLVIADSATVGYYSGGALDKHGALLMQSGGTMTIAGNAMFARGAYLYGGKMNLAGGTLSVGEKGLVVDGGSLVVSPKEKSSSKSVSAVNVALRSGSVTLSEGVEFLSEISQSGGTFAALDGAKAAKLSIKGGQANLGRTEFSETVQVGTTETRKVKDEETGVEMTVTDYYGGSLNIDRSVKIRKGLAVAGDGKAVVADNAVLNTAEKDSDLKKTTGVKVSDRATLQLGKNASVVGNLFVSGGNVNLLGGNEIYGISMTGGVLSATGELKTSGLHLSELGTLSVNGELVILPHTSYTPVPDPSVAVPEPKITIDSGATLAFAAQGHGVSDRLVIGEGQKLVFEDDAVVTIAYNYGDTLPFEASIIELTKEVPADEKVFGYKSAIFKVSVPNAPQYWDTDLKLQNLTFEIAQDSVGDIVLQSGLTTTGEISAHRLYYNYQTPLQTAVQKTILKNEAVSTDIVHELNNMNHVSELLTTYDKLGAPANVVAINELHEKQASAITGAVSRRSRELRSGFIHYDVWSNPLLGNSGFSFSARPNQVAAKGFVPYAVEDVDYPLMVWANGGYSFSEADDGAMSVSSTKSNMLNLLMGADYSVSENLALGVFIGYAGGRTKFDDGSRTGIQSRNIGVYLTGSKTDKLGGSYYGTAIAAFGFEEYDFTRKFSLGAINTEAQASPEGWQGILFFEGGYEWKLDKFSMGPTLSAHYVSNNIDGYTESSEDAWLSQEVDDVSYDSLQTSLGWRIAYRADFETVSILPEIRASWNHEFLGADEDFDAKLALPNADSYTCTIADTGDDYMTLGAGLTMMLGDVSTISVDYDVQIMRDDADPVHSVNAMFRTRF
ncbi:MAG: autotransporter domain-containing protein [Opitutales bacterium]|nr:autotransporter domain-containing protein [Opitutales bacterium]